MKIDTVQQYNDYFGIETSHPLVSVIEGKCAKPLRFCKKLYNVYTILLKDTDWWLRINSVLIPEQIASLYALLEKYRQ